MKIVRAGVIFLLLIGAGAVAYQYGRTWSTFRAAVPPLDASGQKILQDLSREAVKDSTWITLRRLNVDDFAAAAAAVEQRKADIALVRSDVAMPRNGRSVAILQTLYTFLIVPPRSGIEDYKGLKGRTIALVSDSAANTRLLDEILAHYGVPAASVYRVVMKPEDVGAAMQQRKVAAAFVVGPVGGPSAQTFQSIQKAMKGSPKVLGVDDAAAIRQNIAGAESREVSKGVFGGSPVQPEEDLTTIGVTIRMVVPASMSSMFAGELTRVLFEAKAKALPGNPQMREMQQPDAEEKDYPIHPAAQAYFEGEAPTFMDRFESIFWLGWALVALFGSLFGWILSKVRKTDSPIAEQFEKLFALFDETREADLQQLDALQRRVDKAVRVLLEQRANEDMSADQIAIYSMAIDYTRNLIAERRSELASARVVM